MRKHLDTALRMLDCPKGRLACCTLLALALSGLLALHNVDAGPLHNMNDIGGWGNRALFIVMTAAVHAALLLLCALLSRVGFARTALRQLLLTAGLYIQLLAINHKTYAYVQTLQPVIRAMDVGGLKGGIEAASNLSAPMLALMYLITRGPVYDMYMVKLLMMACYLLCALLVMRMAERRGLGVRTEVLFALCLILPQGFMNAACSALPEVAALTLLALSLTLALGCDRPRTLAAGLCYGAACALSGAALCALPAYVWLMRRGPMKRSDLLAAVLVLCAPAVVSGMPISEAARRALNPILGLPAYAGGSPGLMSFIPRAAVEEMPQYAPLLSRLPELNLWKYSQEYYTQAHFEQVTAGVTLAGLALYMGVCALAVRAKGKTALHRAMIFALGALIACANVSAAAWLAMDALCLYAILTEPKLRLPACLTLFATMTSSAYPMTEEVMLPMVYASILCLLALCMLLDVIPTERGESHG